MNRLKISIMAIVALTLLMGCALMDKTMIEKLAVAGDTYNEMQESYLSQYEMASPATQKLWKKKIDPAFEVASLAMNLWREAVETGDDPVAAKRVYQRAIQKVWKILLKYGIEVEEEEVKP